ncbi:MAG: LacI family DNA-binding transcriptional regulator [Alphaproteobacteria bacterium]|nr:LacI family transcriptional regulator [Alphaproteobacteria bacterium]MDE2112113.1 LacI family DNA-binding transcriptional regulator [Alphaproteobacteria bacterium]MDE2493911.1 LacI family DNA-binding transcriptional regulator [Alphaproteobacteria bacterium]
MKGSTLRDVARAAEVSIASASRVINGIDSVTEDVRERVLKAASALHYVPHWGARSLVKSRTNTVGLLLPDIYGEFFSEIIRGIDDAARICGLHLLVSGSHGDLAEATAAMYAMSGRVDGLLVMSPSADSEDLAAALPLSVPLVTIGSRIEGIGQGAIRIDNFGGACAAVRHLAATGCRRIAFIRGPAENFEAQERLRGFSATMAELFPGAEMQTREGDFTEHSGYGAMRALLSCTAPPDGVFVANDMMAVGALLAIKEAGLNVPDDVAVTGFDDIPLARFVSPPLSTLRVGVYELGRQALDLLVNAIERENESEKTDIVISPELVVRESSKREIRRTAET